MTAVSIRLTRETHEKLTEIAGKERVSPGVLIDRLVDQYLKEEARQREAQEFRRAFQESFRELREDPEAWAEYKREFEAWDATLMDGLENEPPYDDDDA